MLPEGMSLTFYLFCIFAAGLLVGTALSWFMLYRNRKEIWLFLTAILEEEMTKKGHFRDLDIGKE